MDDVLEDFIRERKARVAEDKASLQDPPYMEMRANSHRAYVSTAKENIPPKSPRQRKDESSIMVLPHGLEYERKKQRLQQELRMDYRRYMTQKLHLDPADSRPLIHLNNRISTKKLLLDDPMAVSNTPCSPQQKDAATLTEDSSVPCRTLHLTQVKSGHPEAEQEPSSWLIKRHERLKGSVNQESEEEALAEELDLRKDRKFRHVPGETRHEKKRSNWSGYRERTENRSSSSRHGKISQTSQTLAKKENSEFATGLIIGTVDSEEAVQKRKDRYRKELQEQMAEQYRNKRREKDLELKVAATGANDPEKQPDRIRQFGLTRRYDPEVLEPLSTGEREASSSSRALHTSQKIGIREREVPPPDQPHVAFQSPLLEYSSALGLGVEGLSPSSQPSSTSFPPVTCVPRNPAFAPYAPSSMNEAYTNPSSIPHPYYGRGNMLDPYMPYYGQLRVPGCGLPMSYWNMPPGESVHNQFGTQSPQSQHSESTLPIMLPTENAVHTQVRVFPSERSRSTRERILSYREALKKQIQEQQEQRSREKEEKMRQEAQLEADMKSYQPWGRGGGGAPLRDSTGNLIADLNQMHKLNEEAYSNPEQWQKRSTAAATPHRMEHHNKNDRVSGFTHVQGSQFARGNVFSTQPTEQQVQEQDEYKAFLKRQIEEKQRKKTEEEERERLEEEKEERRLAEQRARIQREYEEEQERKKRNEVEQKAKNEELIQLAEQRRTEAERKRKEAEEKENAALKRQYERERQARVEEIHRVPSPPIPTMQKKGSLHQFPPRPPSVDRQLSTASISERSLSGLQSPPVPACRNQLRAAGDRPDVFRELSALRRQLRSKQKCLENHLQRAEWEGFDSPLDNRDHSYPGVDVFDMARLRLQAPVRRPNSRKLQPANLMRIHDSLQLNYTDDESRLGSSDDIKTEEIGGADTGRWDQRDSNYRFSSQRSTADDDYLDLSPPGQNTYQRSVVGRSARGSLLESESAFIDPLGEVSPAPQSPVAVESRQMSARERRRQAKHSLSSQERPASIQRNNHSSLRTHGTKGLHQEAGNGAECRSRNTTRRLRALSHCGNKAGALTFSDEESSPPRISTHNLKTAEAWMQPAPSDTLTCLDRPWRRNKMMT